MSEKLAHSAMGIVCLTPENLDSRWILFESGALSINSHAKVCTFIYDMLPSAVKLPLGQFQHTMFDKADVLSLMATINGFQQIETRLPAHRLAIAFETWWPSLEERMKAVPPPPPLPPKQPSASEIIAQLEKIRVRNGHPVWSDEERRFCEAIGYAERLEHEHGFETFLTRRGQEYFKRMPDRG